MGEYVWKFGGLGGLILFCGVRVAFIFLVIEIIENSIDCNDIWMRNQ